MPETMCCITCSSKVLDGVDDSAGLVLPALAAVLIGTAVLIILATLLFQYGRYPRSAFPLSPVPVLTASMILGAGLGGFVDGIIFHQILQWHAMLSAKLSPSTLETKSINMVWDGTFHAGMLLIVVLGVGILWNQSVKEVDKSGRFLWGGILMGWGLFNIVEGIIDHHILQLHNVREIDFSHVQWNYGFLLASLILLVTGFFIARPKRI